MHSATLTANAFAGGDSDSNVRGWVIFVGTTLLVLGIAAVIYDVTATIVSVVPFGWLLMLTGFLQIAHFRSAPGAGSSPIFWTESCPPRSGHC
jgi:uncharacterized membrane protein HdeD (DUF308 family)